MEGMKAFGETPKAADEDVRAPQSIRTGPAKADAAAAPQPGLAAR